MSLDCSTIATVAMAAWSTCIGSAVPACWSRITSTPWLLAVQCDFWGPSSPFYGEVITYNIHCLQKLRGANGHGFRDYITILEVLC